jgi:hypothetical protein
MSKLAEPLEVCPRCSLGDRTKRKLVLIERGDPARISADWRVSCSCEGDLSVSDLKPEFAVAGPTAQFIQGLYCERCGIGYVPEHMAKPAAPAYRPTAEGWRRVYPDGTLGPLLECIADDPDSNLM